MSLDEAAGDFIRGIDLLAVGRVPSPGAIDCRSPHDRLLGPRRRRFAPDGGLPPRGNHSSRRRFPAPLLPTPNRPGEESSPLPEALLKPGVLCLT
jgi:hypothetical protein